MKLPLKNNISEQKGSVTIEAALILPIIISVFVFCFSLMYMTFCHVKIQNHLNQLSVDLSYSSYALHELGILDRIQDVYCSNKSDSLSVTELSEFVQLIRPIIKEAEIDVSKINSKQLLSIDKVKQSNNSLSDIAKPANDLITSITTWGEAYDTLILISKKFPSTLKTESIYYLTSQLGRLYFQERLQSYCNQEHIDVQIEISHCELFLEDNSGIVTIEYEYNLPIGLGMHRTVTLVNSCYLYAFAGKGSLEQLELTDLEKSDYGNWKNNESSHNQQDKDQDGFDLQVYITPGGAKYHTNPACFHIKVEPYPMMLGTNQKKNPCLLCSQNKNITPSMMIYSTNTSNIYHINQYCRAIYHNIKEISEKEAIVKGYTPCLTCAKKNN